MAILLATGMASAQKKAVIAADETSHDFGQIKEADGKVSATFVVKNTGDAPLAITRVIASCGCTTPEWTKEPIAPGQTGDIKITYDPKGKRHDPRCIVSDGCIKQFQFTATEKPEVLS